MPVGRAAAAVAAAAAAVAAAAAAAAAAGSLPEPMFPLSFENHKENPPPFPLFPFAIASPLSGVRGIS